MPPPSFDKVGSKVKDFSEEDIYWLCPNVKVNFLSAKDKTFLFSLIARPPSYSLEKFYSYLNGIESVVSSTFDASLFSGFRLALTYFPPASFRSALTFPLFTSFYQEISWALSNLNSRSYHNAPFKDPEFYSRTSYTSDNIVTAFETAVYGKKIKSYISLVLRNCNFVIAPRFGISVRKPSRYYVDLKLAYERGNVEAFTYFTWRKLRSLRNWHFGILHKTPRLDLGFYSVIRDKADMVNQSTLTVCYKPNSWSFFKVSLLNNLTYAFNYGFSLTDGKFHLPFVLFSLMFVVI